MAERLPQLLDRKRIQAEMGVTKGCAERIMRDLAKTRIGRRVFVDRADVLRWLEENRETPEGFPLRRTA